MPKRLEEDVVFVKWRVNADDLALLTAVYGDAEGGVNRAVRAILSAVADRLRAKLAGGAGLDPAPAGPQAPGRPKPPRPA